MEKIEAKKTTGLDDFFKGYAPQQLEEKKQIIRSGSSPFEAIFIKYQNGAVVTDPQRHGAFDDEERKKIRATLNSMNEILLPADIDAFLTFLIKADLIQSTKDYAGLFLGKLMQNSYDAGHNDFHLDTAASPVSITYLAETLHGELKKTLHLKISGDVGNYFLESAKYVKTKVEGNVRHGCGNTGEHLDVSITESARDSCGNEARFSSFSVGGSAGLFFGENAFCSSFQAAKLAVSNYYEETKSFGCRFISPDEDGLKDKMYYTPVRLNTFIQLLPDGRKKNLWLQHWGERNKYFWRTAY